MHINVTCKTVQGPEKMRYQEMRKINQSSALCGRGGLAFEARASSKFNRARIKDSGMSKFNRARLEDRANRKFNKARIEDRANRKYKNNPHN